MKAIDGTGLDEVIRARYRAGAVVGGTSAGAAVISEAMITGDADLQSLTAQKTVIAQGPRPLARGASSISTFSSGSATTA